MLKTVRALIICVILVLSMISVGSARNQKEWIDVTTGLDSGGNEITTRVFGYYLNIDQNDQVFVVCDPNTGEEIGEAYIPGVEVGQRDVIVGFESKYGEDFESVKRIDPVTIKMTAPNVFTNIKYTTYSYEQYNQTGSLYQSASSSATWPGSTKGYLIPGSDPDYWLVVSEIYNPNSWPVKVRVRSSLDAFRSSFYSWKPVKVDKEVYLEANEKKYILVNRGKPADCYFLMDDGSNGRSWTKGSLYTYITENMDPELPERLKKNKGYAQTYYYNDSSFGATDLSGGFNITYNLTCRDSKGNWYFTGTVSYTGDGWVAAPKEGTTNFAVAKTSLENMLNTNYADGILPTISNSKTVDGVVISNTKPMGAALSNGPAKERYDLPGPALMDYTGSSKSLFELNDDRPVFSRDGIPVLVYEPLFIEFYRFESSGSSPDEGRLVKEVKPGFVVTANNIRRPYIKVDGKIKDYNIEKITVNIKNKYWKITLNHHVTLTAVNPSDYSVNFSKSYLVHPNIAKAVDEFVRSLEKHYNISGVKVDSPNYSDRNFNPTLASFADISLAPNQSNIIYDEDVTTEILINCIVGLNPDTEYDDVDLREDAINKAVNSAIQYINWTGEAAFRGGTITINPGDGKVQIASFNRSDFKYYNSSRKKYYNQEVGLFETDNKYLKPLSYFKSGVALRATDEAWINLLASKRVSASVMGKDGFWPTYEYSNKYWRFQDSLTARY